MPKDSTLLIVGEITVDFTLPYADSECKLRLGGITHAARGLWACDIKYVAAAVCPKYLVNQARHYFISHGCTDFIWLGEVEGSPNVLVVGDPTEVSHQGYEDILREEKKVKLFDVSEHLDRYEEVLIFPGHFDLTNLRCQFSDSAKFNFDIAYDVNDLSALQAYQDSICTLIISTSSTLFKNIGGANVENLTELVVQLGAEALLLKENRGGSRLFSFESGIVEEIPATLSSTANSVGVGDVYSAVMSGFLKDGFVEAAWRGANAATQYSQTTFPDDFKREVQRSLNVSVDNWRSLGGTFLPWHERPEFQIYLAAPDFSYVHKPEVDFLVSALAYHNFSLRRPIQENGELDVASNNHQLQLTYAKDFELLDKCEAVIAVPLDRDPGTLVEVGLAISMGKPVITYDPRRENKNTMVMAGSDTDSDKLDTCLNGLFSALSNIRKSRQ